MEEHTHRAEARPNAIARHDSTIHTMHDAVDSKPHPIVKEEPPVAHVSIEAFVVCGIESVSRKSHQQRRLHDVSVIPKISIAFVTLVEIQVRPDIVDLCVVLCRNW